MREKWRLHQGWYFAPEDLADVLEEKGPEKEPERWEAVTLPHTYRLEPYTHSGTVTAQGAGTYVNVFTLGNEQKEKLLYLTFEAAMGVTDVWLNGVHLHTKMADRTSSGESGIHTNYGGYLPFVVFLNEAARFGGEENRLVVRTNNEDNGQVPPGKPQELLDFTYFGGIYRDVWLESVEKIFITDPLYEDTVRGGGILLEYPLLTKEKAIVSVKTQIRSEKRQGEEISLLHEVIDGNGECVASHVQKKEIQAGGCEEWNVEMEIQNPSLWNLDHPSLYRMRTSILCGHELVDQKETTFGLRKIEVDRKKGVLINGEVQPFLSGINRHQDYPVIGNAAPASMQKRDAVLFKEAGFRVVRAAHYPMSEAFLDACDELGILVFEATPGWQWFPTDEPEPFSTRVRDNIRQMVRRDRNHPCILAYETVLNESYHVPYGFSRGSALTALEEQSSAKIAAESYGYDASEHANGIDKEADFIYGFESPLEKTEKAVMFLREYTDCYIEYYGEFESRRVTRGTADDFYPHGEARNLIKANQMLFRNLPGEYSLAACYKLRNENPAFTGAAIWTGIDSRGAGSRMSPCGIWDGYRLPKTAYWAYASQQEGKPVLHIASEWSEQAPAVDKTKQYCTIGTDELREIYVYSNAETVTLSVECGEKTVWEKTASPYQEEDAHFLPHPPFYFAEVPFFKGSILRARGYDKAGKLIKEEERKTAGEPYRLSLKADLLGIPMRADGNDLVLIRAEVLDEKGELCTKAEPEVFFRVEGDAQIVGEGDLYAQTNPVRAEAGIASVYVRAGNTAGKITVTGLACQLEEGMTEIEIHPSEEPGIRGKLFEKVENSKAGQGNLAEHPMDGEACKIPIAEIDGRIYPESVLLKGTASWKLKGETYLQMGGQIRHGDPDTELVIYLDDVLRWKGKISLQERITLFVGNASELRMEVRADMPSELLLLSPYLWEEERSREENELSENIAFGKPAAATVRSEWAENIWEDGAWLGGNPRDGKQEWQVDLGELYDVRNAKVQVGGQMGSDCTFYQYEIHTSADGKTWTKQEENRRTSWSNGVLDYFTAKQVRYVKVVFTKVDGRLLAGIQKFEIYKDYGVDSTEEYALSGILVKGNDVLFDPDCLEYRLPTQQELSIQALATDPKATVTVCGNRVPQPEEHKIRQVEPVVVSRESCDGCALVEVCAASGQGKRIYKLYF